MTPANEDGGQGEPGRWPRSRLRPSAANQAGALVRAIRDGWPAPPAWIGAQDYAAAVARPREGDVPREDEDEAHRRE